jgi:hypothetical protein
VTVAFGGDDGPTPEPDYGLPKLATEEAAEEDAAARLLRLRSLVMVKRLYFAVLLATETVDADVAPDPPGKPKLAAVTDPETLADAVDAYVKRCARVVDAEAQCARLDAMLSGMDETAGAWDACFVDASSASSATSAREAIARRVAECKASLTRHAVALLKSLPYGSVEETERAIEEARGRLREDFDGDGGAAEKIVAKTAEKTGRLVKSTRGLVKEGVSKFRERPLSAAKGAAEYTKGVWVRLNGGMDGASSGYADPILRDLPSPSFDPEARPNNVLKLTLEVQDRDRALADASKEREKVMAQGRDSLSRVRLARAIKESDEKVSLLRRVFAVRTLQAEMERIIGSLEEEAALAPSLDAPDRSDEVELLVAEFGVMDAELRKLVSAVDRGAPDLIDDDALTELATDIPDLKSRLGIADEGLTSLSPEIVGERVVRATEESVGKAKEGAEFMSRGVRMLFNDVGTSFRFFGRAVTGSTLRPREVQTIRRTTLDIFTFVPFVIILIIPLTPVGHVLIFSFIQRYFPALFPSQFSQRRQELMKKYEDLQLQLKEAEKSKEMREEDEALQRAVSAVESLMVGGGSEAELAAALAGPGGEGAKKEKERNLFGLKGLRRAGSEDIEEENIEELKSRAATASRSLTEDEGDEGAAATESR